MIENLIGSLSAIFLLIINALITFLISKKIILIKNLKINFLIIHTFFYFILAQTLFFLLLIQIGTNYIKILFYFLYILFPIIILINYNNIIRNFEVILKNGKINIYYFFIFFSIFLLTISPISDPDSLDYHLGGPLEILKEGTLYNRDDHWFHFRLIGSGEMLNLYGLFFHSYNFGQIFQIIPLIHIFVILRSTFNKNIELPILILFSFPILIHLILSAKHILFLTNIYLIIFYTITFYNKELSKNKNLFYLIFLLNFIPIAFKYSYLI